MPPKNDYLDIRLDLTGDTSRAMLRLLAHDKGFDLADAIVNAIHLADQLQQEQARGATLISRAPDGTELPLIQAETTPLRH